jgi:hypothetical protein
MEQIKKNIEARSPAYLLERGARTFREKNKLYGDNWKMVGKVMTALFPNGIELKTPEDHNRYHILMLKIVKLTRYAVNWKKGHPDSIGDDMVYAAMLFSIDEETFGVQEGEWK